MLRARSIRVIARLVAIGGAASVCLALPALAAGVLPKGTVPTVDWGEWPIVAILLLTIFALLWRVEKHLERKDDKTKEISEKFAAVMDRVAAGHSDAMESVKSGMDAIVSSVNESRIETVGALRSHEARIAVLAQVLSAKGELDAEKLESLFDRIRRERF